MKHTLVLPLSDPSGDYLPLLSSLVDDLRDLFERIILGVVEDAVIPGDPFFKPVYIPPGLPVGEQFKPLFDAASSCCPPDSLLHLCFIDRLAFALKSEFRQAFISDLTAINETDLPLLFMRSPAAWEKHPKNYREIEGMATQLGCWVLGKTLDFAWCHLVIQAGLLHQILPEVTHTDMSVMAEIILQVYTSVATKEVDWLAWEDPFILGRDDSALRYERENSREETSKRLGYILPTLQLLCDRGMGFIPRLHGEHAEMH